MSAHRLYTVTLTTECLCYAESPEEAEELAVDQYLNDAPEWTTRALLSRTESATPNHDARYNTLGWYDHSAVYTSADFDDNLTVIQAVALDREAVPSPCSPPACGQRYVAKCYTAKGTQLEVEIDALNVFDAVQIAVKYPGVRNVASVQSAALPAPGSPQL
jgi:hypothetical protein